MSQPREVPHGAEAPVTLAFAEPMPAELPVGATVTLRPLVSCLDGRDLRGGCLRLLRGEDVLATAALLACRDGVNEAEPLSVRTPDELGAFVWTISVSRPGDRGPCLPGEYAHRGLANAAADDQPRHLGGSVSRRGGRAACAHRRGEEFRRLFGWPAPASRFLTEPAPG